jgi:hypothetical protein
MKCEPEEASVSVRREGFNVEADLISVGEMHFQSQLATFDFVEIHLTINTFEAIQFLDCFEAMNKYKIDAWKAV